jgi:hypothetical protein
MIIEWGFDRNASGGLETSDQVRDKESGGGVTERN